MHTTNIAVQVTPSNDGGSGSSPTTQIPILENQERAAKDILQYLETLDPGSTPQKKQLLARMLNILVNLAKVINTIRTRNVNYCLCILQELW